MLRTELANLSEEVLCQLPERRALKKALRRRRRRDLPPNPRVLEDLGELPERFWRTLGVASENSLIHDSIDRDGEDSDKGGEAEANYLRSRVIVFGTRRNLELLSESLTWYVDGEFKVSPDIFTQVFTVLGTVARARGGGQNADLETSGVEMDS
ncbi:hypothetical protein QAD02_002737 [Eretmocerus hayati]|uniref:Uncharacterized protein n=1 Tax=Eretmocerus hayati TaxID=131215 RepID=A0ACC2NKZ4_9HYME|nr:hypothetical protein QAD02_002737 [Eretmocerus hayati]